MASSLNRFNVYGAKLMKLAVLYTPTRVNSFKIIGSNVRNDDSLECLCILGPRKHNNDPISLTIYTVYITYIPGAARKEN